MKDRATGCAHGFGFFFFAGSSVAVRAILLIHVIDVKFCLEQRLLLLQVKLSFYSFLFLPMFFCIFAKGEPGYLSTPCHELASTLIQKQLQDSVTMRDRSEMAQLRQQH
ncbi:unnamed protein product [Brassica oleracea]